MTTSEIKQLIKRVGADGYRDGSSTVAGRTYQPVPFPEFADLPAQKAEHVQREGDILFKHMAHLASGPPRYVLDIGANIGYHSFRFAQRFGCHVLAVEADEDNLRVLEALARWSRLNVWGMQSLDLALSDSMIFDSAIMLNVHHWIHKQRGPAATLDLMKRLADRTRFIYFQTAHRGSGSFFCVEEIEDAFGVARYLIQAGFEFPRLVAITKHGGKDRYLFVASGQAH